MDHAITRRHFLGVGVAGTLTGALAPGTGRGAQGEVKGDDWNRAVAQEQSRYADRSLPEIPVPHFEGTRYDTEVPDTLELTERAELAIHGITSMLDPSRDYLMFSLTWFNRKPPIISTELPEESLSCGHKHMESLPLLRIMSGSSSNIEVDKNFMESMLHMTAKDGVVYLPHTKAIANPESSPPFLEPFASVPGEGRDILALCMWYQHDKNPLWRALIEKKVKRLADIAVHENDYIYFNNRTYRKEWNNTWSEMYFTQEDRGPIQGPSGVQGRFAETYGPHLVNFMLTRSLCIYYRLTGYEPALDLAGGIVRGVRYHRMAFDEDGRWLFWHFHTSTASLMAMLDYATITNDDELLDYVKKAFEYGRLLGDPVVGFFPELVPGSDMYVGRKEINTCETCEVADMIGLALKLTRAGAGDYWGDAERWVRNQYAENQLTNIDWLDKRDPEAFKFMPGGKFAEKPVQPWESADVGRAVGGFAGWSLGNDYGSGQQHMCCSGNASRTMYWVWDSILTRKGESVSVNLLLNRASAWLDVDSYLPNEGKVELKIKDAREVAVRIPEGVDPREVTCKVNGRRQELAWSGKYINARALAKGDRVTVEFPIREQTMVRLIGEFPYRLSLRGNTVVDIEPKGRINPIYLREKYRTDKAPMKKVTRFVSRESVVW